MKTIFDIGMHKGEDTDFYLAKGFRVIAVEAMTSLCEQVTARLADAVREGRLVVVNAAIAAEEGPVDFFVNDSMSVWGTTRPDWAERNARLGAPSRKVTVRGLPLSVLLAEYGIPHYCKIDVEGADLLCVESLRGSPERPRYLSIESTKTRWADLVHEFDVLCELGYSRFKVVNQREVAGQQVPNPAREGLSISYALREGSSGLFGEDLPGPWLTRDEALRVYRGIFRRYRLAGDDGLLRRSWLSRRVIDVLGWTDNVWYDTHAAL